MESRYLLRTRVLRYAGWVMVFVLVRGASGAAFNRATITEVVNSVTVVDPQSRKKAAAEINGLFQVPEIMKTGDASRSEMVAEDRTITRVGADTLFSFEAKERTINLREGSILFQSQSGMGGGTIRTASATASVLGTTIIVVATRDGGFKLLVLEGTGLVRLPNGKKIIVHGGQMVYLPPRGASPSPVFDFRLSDLVRTGQLVTGFKRPLPSWGKIRKQISKQEKQIATGQLGAPGTVPGGITDPNTRINQVQALHLPHGTSVGISSGQVLTGNTTAATPVTTTKTGNGSPAVSKR